MPSSTHDPHALRARWVAWRNRVLASRSFQRWASRTPIVRRIARKRAGDLFDLVAGFAYSQALLATVESGLLDLLAEHPQDLTSIARETGLGEAAASRLVRAAAALDLAEEVSPGRWMLGQHGAALRGNMGAQAMIRHHRLLYRDLAEPLDLLRADRRCGTSLSEYWNYPAQDHDGAAAYSALMAASQEMVAGQIADAYDFGRHHALLDVGGGHGAFIRAIAASSPSLELGIFDLPHVAEGAGPAIKSAGLDRRVAIHTGDFFRDPLPAGYDCISLVRILHDHDDEPCLRLLAAIRRALPPGGRLVVAEPMSGVRGTGPMSDGYFGLYLWAMGSGRPRNPAEIGSMATRAGFANWKGLSVAQPVITSGIVCFT
ncbi:O-methyltransferase [Novosphingobium marinum]|uniref:Demethylspheroidene O-methyltransferase n=1 Tax=Novosphingobium marinum TaxID=1514948 RepID=A0A7Y9XXG4_9SPHN|nr:methyltransferase [Novosphingobium marinum]NYH96401.1 demethylspheroidene O-methyltransferase [Novosphingobium marinum]GGC34916.1 O-methyltransferase [Novosphingobium marinum]